MLCNIDDEPVNSNPWHRPHQLIKDIIELHIYHTTILSYICLIDQEECYLNNVACAKKYRDTYTSLLR